MVASRIGLRQEAAPYDDSFDFLAYVRQKAAQVENLAAIFIDEAHFLKKAQVAQLVEITTELNIAVLTYGLRSDFLGNPFEGSMFLMAWAQEISEIRTICHCGDKATMNLRIDAEGSPVTSGAQIQVGGNESYVSVCLHHFKECMPAFKEYATNPAAPCEELCVR
jgi:thymidine kinase